MAEPVVPVPDTWPISQPGWTQKRDDSRLACKRGYDTGYKTDKRFRVTRTIQKFQFHQQIIHLMGGIARCRANHFCDIGDSEQRSARALDIQHGVFLYVSVTFGARHNIAVHCQQTWRVERTREPKHFDIDFPEEIKSATSEILITDEVLKNGSRLMDLKMPEKTLAIMVKRDSTFFVPTGRTVLMAGDKLLVITDDNAALEETYRELGISK